MLRLLSLSVTLVLVGCAKKAQPTDGTADDALALSFPGTAEEGQLYRALSVRDPEPDCATVEGLVPDPVASLTLIAEQAEMPPWAPLRAASCLLRRHAEAAEDTVRGWVVDPGREGLALLALQHVDQMPEAVAVELVRDALEGPFAEAARDAATGSERPAIQALIR